MSLAAQMRIGSIEILLALAAFGVIVRGWRPGALTIKRRPRIIDLQLHVQDTPGPASVPRDVSLTLGDGLPAAVIGRSSSAQVGLLDPEVSRRHAQLDFTRGVVYLTDLGSANGTFLNGNRLKNEGIEVRPGDDIDVGNTRITVREMAPQART
jgi:pSer/pThr/pTyr-binding forkhead associated (FHA) protein